MDKSSQLVHVTNGVHLDECISLPHISTDAEGSLLSSVCPSIRQSFYCVTLNAVNTSLWEHVLQLVRELGFS